MSKVLIVFVIFKDTFYPLPCSESTGPRTLSKESSVVPLDKNSTTGFPFIRTATEEVSNGRKLLVRISLLDGCSVVSDCHLGG